MISGEIWISTFFVNHYLSQYLMLRYFCAIVECEFEWMRVINNSISKYFIQWYLLIPMKQYLMFITWTKSINVTKYKIFISNIKNARKINILCYNQNVLIKYCLTLHDWTYIWLSCARWKIQMLHFVFNMPWHLHIWKTR